MGEKLLIYEHGRGRYFATESELDEILVNNRDLQVTSKPTSGRSSIDVYQHDLYTPAQKELYKTYPNYDTNIASVKIPYGYAELTILSKKKDQE